MRVSTADAYLGPARRRPNLDIVTDVLVDRVILEARRATGVLTAGGDVMTADRIVCAAGAIHSPALLLRSGIDTAGVGEGAADHPSRMVEIAVKPDASADPNSIVTGAAVRRGPFEIVALNHLGRERPGTAALLVGLLRTRRRGSVRLDPERPDDPGAPPIVDLGRVDDPDEVAAMAEGVAAARRLLAAPAFAEIIDGFEVVRGDGGYAHVSSSCRMRVVVDDRGAVRGYENLYVGDASVFPEIPASGTYLPTVLLAERLAAMWVAA